MNPDGDNRIKANVAVEDSMIGYRVVTLTMDVPERREHSLVESSVTFEFIGRKPVRLIVPVRVRVGAGRPVVDRSATAASVSAECGTVVKFREECL